VRLEGCEGVLAAVSALPAVTPPPRTSTPLATAAVSAAVLVVFAFSTVMNRTLASKRNTRNKGIAYQIRGACRVGAPQAARRPFQKAIHLLYTKGGGMHRSVGCLQMRPLRWLAEIGRAALPIRTSTFRREYPG
jgi:hypothetical protein